MCVNCEGSERQGEILRTAQFEAKKIAYQEISNQVIRKSTQVGEKRERVQKISIDISIEASKHQSIEASKHRSAVNDDRARVKTQMTSQQAII
eukprot:scaffold25965_cov24-Attheya_sp.AAC.1